MSDGMTIRRGRQDPDGPLLPGPGEVRRLADDDVARLFEVPVEMLRRPEREQLIEGIEMHNVLRSAWHDIPEE